LPPGTTKVAGLISIVARQDGSASSEGCPSCLNGSRQPDRRVEGADENSTRRSSATVRRDDDARRLVTIPGVGAIIAASVRALVPDPGGFKSGRHFAAWLGLTPKPHSSGGKERLGAYRRWAIRVALAPGSRCDRGPAACAGQSNASRWIAALLARRPYKVVAVALANKMARIIWALLVKGGRYQENGARTRMAAA